MAGLTITLAAVYRAVLFYRYSAYHTGGLQAQPAQLFLVAKSPPTFAGPELQTTLRSDHRFRAATFFLL